jgi:hypothetical protein
MAAILRRLFAAGLLLAAVVCAPIADAAQILIQNNDGPGEGLNDPSAATPVGGNPGTTIGQQRLFVLQRVAETWGAVLQSNPAIVVRTNFDLLECGATSAVLASAGPITAARDFAGAPRANTWYPIALANAIAGSDLDQAQAEISARFNSRLGQGGGCGFSWYYGVDANPPAGTVDLFSTALHELAHGLGFVALFNAVTGEKMLGFDDVYLVNLLDETNGQPLRTMSNSSRAAACLKPDDLLWTGAATTAASSGLTGGVASGGRVPMYSPAQYRAGSSVSHFTTSLVPNELMEPSYTGPTRNLDLTTALFTDLGWPTESSTGPCIPSTTRLCLLDGRFAAVVRWSDGGPAGLRDAFVAAPRTSGEGSSAGLFSFYQADPNNWELLVKMIDGCGSNGRFWLLVSASTGFEWELTVTDLVAGTSRTFQHPLDGQASGIADFAAFDTCNP